MKNLQTLYQKTVRASLKKQFHYTSDMQIPRLLKIVINMTAGNDVSNSKAVNKVQEELAQITGQKPYLTHAKKSLAAFKLRAGMPMGGMVTLRRDKMWDFMQKLIHVVLPRVRDFRGLKTSSFDKQGNFALGISEQIIFPEIDFDKIDKIRGLDVIFVTNAKTKEESFALLKKMGMPFRKESQ